MSGNKAHYLPLDGCADSDESLVLTAQKSKGRNWKWFLVVLLSNGLTFFSSITWSSFYNSCPYPPSTMVESVLASFMSEIDRTFHTEVFNSFEYNFTRYTARTEDVGDEVEKSWADLGIYEAPIVIPAAQVSDYGIEKTGHVWLDPKDNPAAPYAGMSVKVQVLHYLHCVNYLRQGLWYNVDYYRARGHPMWDESQHILTGPQSVPLVELHTAHCIDLLRQVIMCNVDLGVLPFLLSEQDDSVVLDFARSKQCKNFDSFLSWYKKHTFEGARLEEDTAISGHVHPLISWSGRSS